MSAPVAESKKIQHVPTGRINHVAVTLRPWAEPLSMVLACNVMSNNELVIEITAESNDLGTNVEDVRWYEPRDESRRSLNMWKCKQGILHMRWTRRPGLVGLNLKGKLSPSTKQHACSWTLRVLALLLLLLTPDNATSSTCSVDHWCTKTSFLRMICWAQALAEPSCIHVRAFDSCSWPGCQNRWPVISKELKGFCSLHMFDSEFRLRGGSRLQIPASPRHSFLILVKIVPTIFSKGPLNPCSRVVISSKSGKVWQSGVIARTYGVVNPRWYILVAD